jgi:hypothetical protein|tara:strand:- start:1513 stop:2424 length:912 start_codon:yes stop_codon:yes gene_type:complete
MALKGKKLDSDLVMFGEPLTEKALNALQRSSPTADQIIKSLPPTAFIPMPEETQKEKEVRLVVEKENSLKEEVASAENMRRERLKKKKENALKKRKARLSRKKPVVQSQPVIKKEESEKTIIKTLIEENINIEEKISMNLDDELKALEKDIKPKVVEPVAEPQPVVEESVQTDLKDQILELLEGEENPPSLELISAWKEAYGKNGIHVMAFGEGDVYVYHHLTRGEWKKIKEIMNKMRESENSEEVEEKLKEKVVLYCVLWPSIDERWLDYCKAGILDSLYQMILLNSGFLTPQQAMLLTTQL